MHSAFVLVASAIAALTLANTLLSIRKGRPAGFYALWCVAIPAVALALMHSKAGLLAAVLGAVAVDVASMGVATCAVLLAVRITTAKDGPGNP